MAIIKRCIICDEKLVRNRCPLCGLDHTRQMKINYRLNTSRPYHMPTQQSTITQNRSKADISGNEATQTVPNRRRQDKSMANASARREEYSAGTVKPIRQPQVKQKKKPYEKQDKKQGGGQTWIRFLPIIVLWVLMIVGILRDESNENHEREPEYTTHQNYVNEEFYEAVQYQLTEEGESFEIVLSQGEYLVGTHLPEGYYHVELIKGSSLLNITNPFQGIYDWYHFFAGEGGTIQLEDLPLYQDTHLRVMEGAYLALSTTSGQIDTMYETIPNPLQIEEITLEEGIYYTVGRDFPAGVYDLQQTDGCCYLIAGFSDDTGSDSINTVYRDLWFDVNSNEKSYRNMILEDGMVVYMEPDLEGTTVLIPGETIKADGYDTYYELYR